MEYKLIKVFKQVGERKHMHMLGLETVLGWQGRVTETVHAEVRTWGILMDPDRIRWRGRGMSES